MDLHAVPCTEYSIGLVPNQKHFVSWRVVDLRADPCSADTARADWWIGAHRSRHRRECASLPCISLGHSCTDSASETLSRRHVCRDGHSNSGYPTAINSCRTRLGGPFKFRDGMVIPVPITLTWHDSGPLKFRDGMVIPVPLSFNDKTQGHSNSETARLSQCR